MACAQESRNWTCVCETTKLWTQEFGPGKTWPQWASYTTDIRCVPMEAVLVHRGISCDCWEVDDLEAEGLQDVPKCAQAPSINLDTTSSFEWHFVHDSSVSWHDHLDSPIKCSRSSTDRARNDQAIAYGLCSNAQAVLLFSCSLDHLQRSQELQQPQIGRDLLSRFCAALRFGVIPRPLGSL